MTNREKLKELLMDVFLIDSSEFRFDMVGKRLSRGIRWVLFNGGWYSRTFGYHMKPEEAVA